MWKKRGEEGNEARGRTKSGGKLRGEGLRGSDGMEKQREGKAVRGKVNEGDERYKGRGREGRITRWKGKEGKGRERLEKDGKGQDRMKITWKMKKR